MRTANKDKGNYQLNQYLFKIPADFLTQCQKTSLTYIVSGGALNSTHSLTHVHSQIQDDASDCLSVATSVPLIIRGSEVATERQRWRDITSRQSFRTRDTQATAVSNMVSVVLPATLVNDNSDDKPRHLPLREQPQ